MSGYLGLGFGWSSVVLLLLFWLCEIPITLALLEERFATFSDSDSSIPIHDAVVLHDADDYAGVLIAARSLVEDFEQITGNRPQNITWNPSGNGTGIDADTAIIIGSVESGLIQAIIENDKIDINDIEGKWETFKTTVVSEPLPGIGNALIIVGSDMRGTAFGVYTLAEQCGQSP